MVLGKKRKENRFIQFECLRMLPFFCDFGQEVERMGEPREWSKRIPTDAQAGFILRDAVTPDSGGVLFFLCHRTSYLFHQ